jgi:hypothetical protein
MVEEECEMAKALAGIPTRAAVLIQAGEQEGKQ